jgi:hypothetical protein
VLWWRESSKRSSASVGAGGPFRGIAITPTRRGGTSARRQTNRPVEAVVAARVKPDGGRSRLLNRRSRAGTDAAVHRHAFPADGRHSPRSATAASPCQAVASSPPARVLPQLVRSSTDPRRGRRFRFHAVGCLLATPSTRLTPLGCGLAFGRLCDRAAHARAGDSIRRKALPVLKGAALME